MHVHGTLGIGSGFALGFASGFFTSLYGSISSVVSRGFCSTNSASTKGAAPKLGLGVSLGFHSPVFGRSGW